MDGWGVIVEVKNWGGGGPLPNDFMMHLRDKHDIPLCTEYCVIG